MCIPRDVPICIYNIHIHYTSIHIYITREREIERERESVCTSMSLKHGMLELGL